MKRSSPGDGDVCHVYHQTPTGNANSKPEGQKKKRKKSLASRVEGLYVFPFMHEMFLSEGRYIV